MCERPGIKIVADFTQKLSLRTKLQKLCRSRSVGGPARVAARENEDVSFGIDCDSSRFTQVNVGRKLQKIRNRAVSDFRHTRLLRPDSASQEQAQRNGKKFHSRVLLYCARIIRGIPSEQQLHPVAS